MNTPFENVFEPHNRHSRSSHSEWTEALCIAIALQLLFVTFSSAWSQSVPPRHLPTNKQVAPMSPEEEKNLAFVLDWWRKVVEARHTELAANYAAEDFIQHNPNIPTGRASLLTFFKGFGPPIEPIPNRLVNPPVVAGARGNFVWLVFEHQNKDPKDTSQWIYGYSFDLFRIQNGKIQEHWDSALKEPGSGAFIPSTAPPPATWNMVRSSTIEQQNLAIATRFEKDVIEYGHIENIEELSFVLLHRAQPRGAR